MPASGDQKRLGADIRSPHGIVDLYRATGLTFLILLRSRPLPRRGLVTASGRPAVAGARHGHPDDLDVDAADQASK